MSYGSRTAYLALGALGCLISPSWAKPPDLPAKQTITCQPPAEEKPATDGLIRTGIDFNTLPKDLLVTEEEQEWLEAIDLTCPCFWEVLQSYWRSWSLSLAEIFAGNPAADPAPRHTSPPAAAPAEASTCPYLQQQAARKSTREAANFSPPGSVLDNLSKLEEAQALWRRAEDCRKRGDVRSAVAHYAQIQQLCPGSTYHQMATRQINELQARGAWPTPAAGAMEEQEAMPPCP